MKKTVVLVLVLLVVFSSQLFSETLDCQQSFELGKVGATEKHRVSAWYFLGFGNVFAALFVGNLFEDSYQGSQLAFTVVLSIPFIAAFLSPRRETISPSSGGVELECYRDGYKRRASWKNCGALLLGGLTVLPVAFARAFLIPG